MKTNPDDSIHPEGKFNHDETKQWVEGGLTKREYFAAMAMQGILANPYAFEHGKLETFSKTAIEQADALISQLNKQP